MAPEENRKEEEGSLVLSGSASPLLHLAQELRWTLPAAFGGQREEMADSRRHGGLAARHAAPREADRHVAYCPRDAVEGGRYSPHPCRELR